MVFPPKRKKSRVKWFCHMKIYFKANGRGHANHGVAGQLSHLQLRGLLQSRLDGLSQPARHQRRISVMPGMGFGAHPHRDMEIPVITYIFERQARAQGIPCGNGRVIKTGDIQYMAAGKGVQHSEFNPAKDEAVHLLQVWIQPDAKGVTPRYAEKSFANAAAGKLNLVTSKTGRDGLDCHPSGRPICGSPNWTRTIVWRTS